MKTLNQPKSEIIEFIRSKLVSAKASVHVREQMERSWRSGDDNVWVQASMLHPSTAGKRISKEDRLKEAETHKRIAIKCRHEAEMFEAVLAELQS